MNQTHSQLSAEANPGPAQLQPTPSFDLLGMDAKVRRRANVRRVAKLGGWSLLVAAGLSRRGLLGWVSAAGGVYGLVAEVLRARADRPEWQKASSRGGSWVQRLLRTNGPDEVDRSSALSFPASDSPGAGVPSR